MSELSRVVIEDGPTGDIGPRTRETKMGTEGPKRSSPVVGSTSKIRRRV